MSDIVPRLIETFRQTAPRDLEQAAAAVRDSDADDLEDATHNSKRSCRNLGALRLRDLCQQLEKLGPDGSLQSAPERLALVEEEFNRVRAELVAALDRHRI